MKKGLIAFAAMIILASSCKKKTTEEEKPKTIPEDKEMRLITSSPWLAYKLEMSGLDVWTSLVDICTRDDTYRFYKDSTLMQYENAKVCSGQPDSTGSSWEFYEGRSRIIATIIGIQDTATIIQLDEKDMKLSCDYNGVPIMIYFKKP